MRLATRLYLGLWGLDDFLAIFIGLEKWYEFGKIDWVSELEYPEWTVKEVGRFLVTFE